MSDAPKHWLTSAELAEALEHAHGSIRLTAAIVMARELLEERCKVEEVTGERDALTTRQQELLQTIRNLSSQVPYEEESRTAATLIAEVGTLKSRLRNVEARYSQAHADCQEMERRAETAEREREEAMEMASIAEGACIKAHYEADSVRVDERERIAAWLEAQNPQFLWGPNGLAAAIRGGADKEI